MISLPLSALHPLILVFIPPESVDVVSTRTNEIRMSKVRTTPTRYDTKQKKKFSSARFGFTLGFSSSCSRRRHKKFYTCTSDGKHKKASQ